jgi:hypothetical protein
MWSPKVWIEATTIASLGILLVNYINKRNYVLIVADLILLFLSIGVIWLVLKTFLRPAAKARVAVRAKPA